MVYQIFDDGIETSRTRSKRFRVEKQVQDGKRAKSAKARARRGTEFLGHYGAGLLILLIKLSLFLYDIFSLPVYFLLQRPDKQARAAQATRSQQVDANTWIRTSQVPNEIQNWDGSPASWAGGSHRRPHKFMGSTMSEIFANCVRDYHSRACLGYRAVVTCPVFVLNEAGKSVLQEKSFRSDYTWYTYGQVGRRVQDIASGLYQHAIYPDDRGLFMASTCLEWFCVAQACFQLAIHLVLTPDVDEPVKTLAQIIAESRVEVLFVSCDQLDKLCQLLEHLFGSDRLDGGQQQQPPPPSEGGKSTSAVRRIVLIDWQFAVDFNEAIFTKLGQTMSQVACQCELEILSLGQIEEAGIENPIQLRCSSSLSQENLNFFAEPNSHRKQFDEQPNFSSNSNELQGGGRRKIGEIDAEADRLYHAQYGGLKSSSAPLIRRQRGGGGGGRRVVQKGGSPQEQSQQTSAYLSPNHVRPANPTPGRDTLRRVQPEDLAMIVYTYGSLGQLKPVIVSHSQLARSNDRLFLDGMLNDRDVHCTILPLASVIEFMTEICIFCRGGSIGYSCNMQTFFYDGNELFQRDKSDLEALNPSFLLVKPYILERLRTSITSYIQLQLNPIASFVHKHVLYDYKKYWARRHFGTPIVDRLFCAKLKSLFGERIKYFLCNGATDCSETKDFFAFMVGLPVIELYGPTEALVSLMSVNDIWDYKRRSGGPGGAPRRQEKSGYGWRLFQFDVDAQREEDRDETHVDEEQDYQNIQLMPPTQNRNIYRENLSRNILITSSILCPTSGTRIRLEDWEEFRASDHPYPRGRIVIGGELVSRGYWRRPALAEESFYEDSQLIRWFRTGDIARVFPNGSFEIISAISDMIKMVDGQFISLSQIEHILRNSQFVDNVCAICGDDRTFVIILVVPNLRRLALKSPGEANLKKAICLEPEPEELIDVDFRREVCNDRLLCEFISDHLNELVAKSGLESIANRFLLVPEIWTPESELVTPAYKPKRVAIQKFYANDIQSIVGMGLLDKSNSQRLSARRRLRSNTFQNSPILGRSQQRNFSGGRLTASDSMSSVNSI